LIDYVSLGKRIRYYRQKCSITQERLAEKVDVSLPHMSRIEGGKTKPSLQVLIDVANALNVTIDQLLYDSVESDKLSPLIPLNDILSDCSKAEIEMITESARAILAYARKAYQK